MIQLSDLSFKYQSSKVWSLKDINMEIKAGECVVITGPSGCGKSTVLKCINGLIPHYEQGKRAGHVYVCKKEISTISMYDIGKTVGSVFQNPRSQFFTTSVEDEIMFGCLNFGISGSKLQQRLNSALEHFDLVSLRHSSVFQLSAGERQRAILAAIHAMDPKILVLDEPSANLDTDGIKSLQTRLHSLMNEGKTLIVVEHRFHYLNDIADRVIVMNNGKISSEHTMKSLKSKKADVIKDMGLRRITFPYIPLSEKLITEPTRSDNYLNTGEMKYQYPHAKNYALKEVQFSASKGEIVAVRGGNGSGKTTLAMILCGLIKGKEENIIIDEKRALPKMRMQRCKMVLQEADHQLFTENVYSEMKLAVKNRKDKKKLIEYLLTKINLKQSSSCHPQYLSGGEKQRLVIATALVACPDIVILDEPTSGLDLANMHAISKLLCKMAKKGSLVLAITHDEEFIQNCCSRSITIIKKE